MSNEDATLLGLGVPVQFEGKTHVLGPIGPDEAAEFTAWCEREAWLAVTRARDVLSPAEYANQLNATRRDVASKVYAFGKPAFSEAMGSTEGLTRMTRIALRVNDPKATEEFAARLVAEKCEPELDADGKPVLDPATGEPVPGEIIRALGVLLSSPKAVMRRGLAGGAASPPPRPSAS